VAIQAFNPFSAHRLALSELAWEPGLYSQIVFFQHIFDFIGKTLNQPVWIGNSAITPALAEVHPGRASEALVLATMHLGRALQQQGDMEGGKVYLQRAMALGSVTFRQECPEATATLSRMEMALDGGTVVSRAIH
jgi:hypothetical protein